MLGKIVPGNYYLDLLAIFKRKHIVKMNSVKAVLAMVGIVWLRTVKSELGKMGSYAGNMLGHHNSYSADFYRFLQFP